MMSYHSIVPIDMQYTKNHKEETMPLRDENTKIRSIDDELKRLTEELGLVIDIPDIPDVKEDESKKDEEKEDKE